MRQLVTTFFLLITAIGNAQTFPIKGTTQTFPKKYVDSLTATVLSYKSTYPLVINRDSLLQLIREPRSSEERILLSYNIVENSDWLTPEQGLYYYNLILKEAQKLGDKVLEATILAELGYTNSQNGNTASGLKMIYKALEMAEATGNGQAIGIAYGNLGLCYPNNNKLAKEYFVKSLEYSRKANAYLTTAYSALNFGRLYMQEQKMDSALPLILECYQIAVAKYPETVALPYGLLNLSELDKQANYLHYMRQVSLLPNTVRSDDIKFWVAMGIARYYIFEKKLDSAFFYASEMNRYVSKLSLYRQLEAITTMGEYYKTFTNKDSTLFYMEKYYQVKDSLYGTKVVEEAQNMAYTDMQRQKELEAAKAAFQNRMVLYFISAVAIFLTGLAFTFWRSRRKEQKAKALVQQQNRKLEQAIDQLKSTQSQLIQSEKMASLGELTAGIAHEIQNPLNFVNNFSEVSSELIKEMVEEVDKGNTEEVKAIAGDVVQNLEKINHHGKRAADIVKGMLQHISIGTGKKELTDINSLADEYLRLAYHGLRAKDKNFNATMKTDFDETIGNINIIPQDMGRVILNLINNAFYAVKEKALSAVVTPTAAKYDPTVSVSTKKIGNKVEIRVADNGNGIPPKILDKIFQPFFTTKPTGQGTGLGLSLSYDIVKAHGGEIKVETKVGEGTKFIISLTG